jgi:hypothetical protein
MIFRGYRFVVSRDSSRPPAIRPKRLVMRMAGADHLDRPSLVAQPFRAARALLLARLVLLIVGSIGLLTASAPDAPAGQTTAAGVYTTGQADRGRGIFEAKCESCHGAALDGGTLAPALTGREFLSSFQEKPLRRMYSRIISTMPPDEVGSLTEAETLALVALLLRANGYPAGERELARADDLNSIVVAARPEVGSRKSEVESRKSKVGSRKSEVESQQSKVEGRRSTVE